MPDRYQTHPGGSPDLRRSDSVPTQAGPSTPAGGSLDPETRAALVAGGLRLVDFALAVLPTLKVPSGLYCYDRQFGGAPRGESIRYSLMVALGLQRAQAAGIPTGTDPDELLALCLSRIMDFSPGDMGLALWAATRAERVPTVSSLATALASRLRDESELTSRPGMEIAWIAIGLIEAELAGVATGSSLGTVLGHMRRRRTRSGLYLHNSSNLRRLAPNFATEIYTLMALVRAARAGIDEIALDEATRLADLVLALQRPDGGWPWLYDATRGVVSEEYEIYSVHQDGMAPMALFELAQLTGRTKYSDAALHGLPWSRGQNELGVDLLDMHAGFAHRSIRRRNPWSRLALAANASSTRAFGRPVRPVGRALELNATCRPYHLGWILEAWAGRRPDIFSRPMLTAEALS